MIEPARFEILPFARGEEEAAALPEPVKLTVTCSPTYGLDHTVEVARRLRLLGHAATVHVAARMVRDRAHLDAVLAALAEAQIDEIFLIGGDAAAGEGPYASALELLPRVHQHPLRPRTIGIAGYPEGHPLIDSATLTAALLEKSQMADYITTQLCFDPQAVLQWVRAMRQAGLTLPVMVGLPGVVDRRKLLEISMRVGVGASLTFLRKQGGLGTLWRLSARSSVERLHEALSPFMGDASLGIAGLHYFTFNRLLETWRYARAQAQGRALEGGAQKEVTPR